MENEMIQRTPSLIRNSIQGRKFGKWSVISWAGQDKNLRNTMWLCKCDCGNEKIVNRTSLVNGCSQSCGCLNHFTGKNRILNNIDIDENGCWNWKLNLRPDGYGRMFYDGVYLPAHRASYIIFKGKIERKKLACHTCDNKKCVNPDHIYIGTHKSNRKDADERNRMNFPKGENHHMSIFTNEQVIQFREDENKGLTISQIAKKYSVDYRHIHLIIKRKIWNHI